MHTAVALMIFNRPDRTERVFNAIRQAQPPILLVVADGPRIDRVGEAELCAATRAIIDRVDWPCEVLTNYAQINLGCKYRIASGLDWVFANVPEAIILEDDCLPDPTFFPFCEELLAYYRHDDRIGAISGHNMQFGNSRTADSYYFSHFPHCWGWASWQRVWQHYDVEMTAWNQIRDGKWLYDLLPNSEQIDRWHQLFQDTYDGKIDSWDCQWTLTCWLRGYLTATANVNLISNLGFGPEATHTTTDSELANLPTQSLSFPLRHPSFTIRDTQADLFAGKTILKASLW